MKRMPLNLLAGAAGVAALVTALILWHVNPSEVRVYPGCPFHALTGLYCPSCGGIRAAHALLHGRLGDAAGYNLYLLLMLPGLALAVWAYWRGYKRSVALPLIVLLGVAGALFWIARNLPGTPFSLLAP